MRLTNKISHSAATAIVFLTGTLVTSTIVGTSAANALTLTQNVTGIQYGAFTDGANSTINGITYLNQSLPFRGITANSVDWAFGNSPQPVVTLRRGGYAPTDSFGNYNDRDIPSSERLVGDPETTVRIPYPISNETVLSQNNIFAAVDNVFVNAGYINGIQTDIERVDFVFQNGLKVSPGLAIALFDRGPATAHDGFQIAPVLSIDNTGNPTSYGSLGAIAPGWGQTNLRPGGGSTDNLPYTVLTNSSGEFGNVLSVNQQIGGLLIPLTDLSSAPIIYGFSLFAPDVTDGGNATNLLNWTNSNFFPQDTPNAIGGLDLVAGSGQIAAIVPEPSSIFGLSALIVIGMGATLKRKI
ncbi:PEP-CTERM sorting domain-containing protein [Crocosphaera sp. XPORK-15E]|uniref:PEP-CTERM sorting domain-containing protein n=1 Tax=Crocosphaera sp. XPORK-15E TaxID=3110247 RepID=UPI002B1F6587|nr:PEP-CTERM sorting domain-containing protein [Crocosphaera sp. XPORK-15E]MEA5532943.1 PEP-CTERM sorting domain-containing protein [Crocosphaera sp. XPORK-15E]